MSSNRAHNQSWFGRSGDLPTPNEISNQAQINLKSSSNPYCVQPYSFGVWHRYSLLPTVVQIPGYFSPSIPERDNISSIERQVIIVPVSLIQPGSEQDALIGIFHRTQFLNQTVVDTELLGPSYRRVLGLFHARSWSCPNGDHVPSSPRQCRPPFS